MMENLLSKYKIYHTKWCANVKPTQFWIIFGFCFKIANRVAIWFVWSLTWIWRAAVYLIICKLSGYRRRAFWKHLAASLKSFLCLYIVPHVCQQNILFILLFSRASFPASKAFAYSPKANKNKAFKDMVSGWSGWISNNF